MEREELKEQIRKEQLIKKGYYTVDLYMNTVDQCYAWGSRYVTIYIL